MKKIEAILDDGHGKRQVVEVERGEFPARISVPVLMEGGFGARVYSLTGEYDQQGRPIYGDPQ